MSRIVLNNWAVRNYPDHRTGSPLENAIENEEEEAWAYRYIAEDALYAKIIEILMLVDQCYHPSRYA